MRLLVDTGVFSAALSRTRPAGYEPLVARIAGNQLFLAPQTVAELRYGALVAGWGRSRRQRLEAAIATATVVPVSDRLVTAVADLRFASRRAGHPLADRVHANDLWIAACAIHIGAALLTADRVFKDAPGLTLA
ncbi:MAG: PIN domain-containing protein [Acidimicrobiales bacterium]